MTDPSTPSLRRRQLLSLAAAATFLPSTAARSAERLKTQARIVIMGAGAAGLSCAARLARVLDGAHITLIDARQQHLYQPGYTLVAAGIKGADYPISSTAEHVPAGVQWVPERVNEIDPEVRSVRTDKGQRFDYDFLFVTTGLVLDYAAIEGMDESLIGREGIGSIYHSPQAAQATWQAMSRFTEKGGVGVFFRPASEIKCAGAPLKYTFLTEDYLSRRGTRGKSQLIYHAHNKGLFSVPVVNEKVKLLFRERGVQVHYERVIKAIDPARRIVTFTTPEGTVEQPYDFINIVPPMKAPDAVRNSPLPWQSGPWAQDGWLEVDKHTLRHVRYPNIFGVGDIAGVPKGKTAASVKWQVPVAVEHLLADIAGKSSEAHYNGYTSCPLVTRLGRAMLVEFDYQDNLLPSFPGAIAPLEELWASWVLKTSALHPTYIQMLRGRV